MKDKIQKLIAEIIGDGFTVEVKPVSVGNVSSVEGAPHGDCLVLRSEWNAKEGCSETSRVEPEKESDWQPTPNEWVRLPNHTVRQYKSYEIHGTKKYYRFEGFKCRFELGSLKPWTPKVGEFVKVIREYSMNRGLIGIVKRDDGKNGFPYFVETDRGTGSFSSECLEPAEPATDHIADADKKVPPAGYRLLDKSAKVEPRKIGDLFLSCSVRDWMELDEFSVEYANRDDWPACRKIEQPAKAPEPQYREPTYADLANGPIEVEVCDDEAHETNWVERILYAVLPAHVRVRFVCEWKREDGSVHRWKHARLKVR